MKRRAAALGIAASVAILVGGAGPHADQGRRGAPPPSSAREGAPIDLTGYWVSVISEDWRWRMVTPLRGDFANIPVNAAARKVGNAWDPSTDEAAGTECKAYGAAAIMREPGRLRITWEDDDTLRIDTDAGMQTRLLHFGDASRPPSEAGWQGHSVARWETPLRGVGPLGFGLGLRTRAGGRGRALEVRTTEMRPGYLRKNGIPYSDRATMSEYFNLFAEPDGTEWFVITVVVEDPVYLNAPWVTTPNFKREADGSKWNPTPCTAR